jgi:hypothetical protein
MGPPETTRGVDNEAIIYGPLLLAGLTSGANNVLDAVPFAAAE